MAQWTLKYTTVEDPSNYITVTGSANKNSYYNIPYNLFNSTSMPNLYNVNITGINSSDMIFYSENNSNTGTDFSGAFKKLYYLDNLSNTSKIVDMSDMFRSCQNLITISNFDTSNVTNMYLMFKDCTNLTTVSNLDTSNVKDMNGMFNNCTNLTTVPNFNTSNVIYMNGMFYDCDNLINIPNFNTSKVDDMSDMFLQCSNLINIPNFDTSNVTDMSRMFYYCKKLNNIPNFNTINVTDMSSMFSACQNLVNAPFLNTSNVEDMGWMYQQCRNLINIPVFNTSKVVDMDNMFGFCFNLSNLSLKNIARSLPNVSQLTSQNSNLQNIGLSQNQINYISTTKYASQLQARGWNIEDNYVKPDLVKSLKMKQSDGTMNLAMLGTNAEYVDMEDGTTLEETVQNLKQYIDDNVANILGGMY